MRFTALVLSIAIASPAAANDRAMVLLEQWIVSVDQHVPGETDQALAGVTKWTLDDLELMRPYVHALTGVPINDRDRVIRKRAIDGNEFPIIRDMIEDLQLRGDFDQFRKRAVILHTDAAILGGEPIVVQAPPARTQQSRQTARGAGIDVRSNDGRVDRLQRVNPHWTFAMDLLDALPVAPQRDPIVAQWYRSIGAYFANEHNYADAVRHFEKALKIVGDDPGVLFEDACLQEALGAPRIQNFVRVTILPNGLKIRDIESPKTHFRRAENQLRKALAVDPDFTEANLRLGRVLTQLEQYQEALPFLARASAATHDRVLSYYAHLFSADAMHALGRLPEAENEYLLAIELFPDAQAARFGLGALHSSAGSTAKALDAMLPSLSKSPEKRVGDDPWWDYYSGDTEHVNALLAELRLAAPRVKR